MSTDNLRVELQVLAEAYIVLHTADLTDRIMAHMPEIVEAVTAELLGSGARNLYEIAQRQGTTVDELLDTEIAALLRTIVDDALTGRRGPS